jgi:hypothetical protein
MTDVSAADGAVRPQLPRRRTSTRAVEQPPAREAAVTLARPPAELVQRVKDGLLDAPT